MPDFPLRKTMIFIEDIHHEGGPPPAIPRRRAAIVALVKNPFAGRYVADLQSAMDDLKPLGLMMTDRLIEAMGGIEGIDGYGKAGLAGEAGELEHTALWHVPGGYAMRERLGAAKAIVPSAMKVGGPGTRIDIPLGHINAAYVRSHFDAMEVGLPDGPRADELLFALAMSRGGRIHHRMGGLQVEDVTGEDGLR
ncbi:amino acid synthesis family protein [Antarcticimicrobium sediminis]|uniref:Amino acid synthesis family protein n=1 Tax=Antarcticimicrobium sediminis TaxID=2546227 RepID=A0A4R5EW50_9RHOB|nr:amino acid synthesis family protein [Antarcticimicrobium sediminis]TDE38967.1 amino acid synthesis family protein [Antarcticimicrobium sediminis]